MAIVLLKPAQSTGASSVFTNSVVIAPTQTEILDTVPLSSVAVKWVIAVENNSTGDSTIYEILVRHSSGMNLLFSRYGRVGPAGAASSSINHEITFTINGSVLELNVTNNTSPGNTITAYSSKVSVF